MKKTRLKDSLHLLTPLNIYLIAVAVLLLLFNQYLIEDLSYNLGIEKTENVQPPIQPNPNPVKPSGCGVQSPGGKT